MPQTGQPPTPLTGRFAPSPTGRLHIGSLVAAVGSWLAARSGGGRWLLRIDDLDTPRQVTGMDDDIMATLEAFGLYWDGAVSRQSSNLEAYQEAFEQLKKQGMIYPCGCSRKEIAQAASAPHNDSDGIPYPGTCRNGMPAGATVRSYRMRTSAAEIYFRDLRRGEVCQNLAEQCGDFVVKRGDGVFSYQLAVVIDDGLGGVTQVVRGDDLLPSTGRQILIQQLLGLPRPDYCHLPLVTGPGGSKLSKRDNLVSSGLGCLTGNKEQLLVDILDFLRQLPPRELARETCQTILAWGIEQFDLSRLPAEGGPFPSVG